MAKKSEEKNRKKKISKKKLITVISALVVLAVAVTVVVSVKNGKSNSSDEHQHAGVADSSTLDTTLATGAYRIEGCTLSKVYSFSGAYVEDGTEENVENIAAINIKNTSGKNIELLEIKVTCTDVEYIFSAKTIPAGESITVFEADRKAFSGDGEITASSVEKIAFFSSKLTIYPDVFEIYAAESMLTIKNISGADIDGEIIIYYKNYDDNGLYGGITYFVKTDSIADGAMIQLPASHYSMKNSKVVFVRYAEAAE